MMHSPDRKENTKIQNEIHFLLKNFNIADDEEDLDGFDDPFVTVEHSFGVANFVLSRKNQRTGS